MQFPWISPGEFFTTYLFHPLAAPTPKDRLICCVASVACSIIPLVCAIRNHFFTKISQPTGQAKVIAGKFGSALVPKIPNERFDSLIARASGRLQEIQDQGVRKVFQQRLDTLRITTVRILEGVADEGTLADAILDSLQFEVSCFEDEIESAKKGKERPFCPDMPELTSAAIAWI
jgi:hypothetical protein